MNLKTNVPYPIMQNDQTGDDGIQYIAKLQAGDFLEMEASL